MHFHLDQTCQLKREFRLENKSGFPIGAAAVMDLIGLGVSSHGGELSPLPVAMQELPQGASPCVSKLPLCSQQGGAPGLYVQGSCLREDQCSSQDLQPLVAGVVQLPFRIMCHLARVPAGADPQKLELTFLPSVTSRIVPFLLLLLLQHSLLSVFLSTFIFLCDDFPKMFALSYWCISLFYETNAHLKTGDTQSTYILI